MDCYFHEHQEQPISQQPLAATRRAVPGQKTCPFVLVLVVVLVLDLLGFCGEKRIRFSPVTIVPLL
jgi:hypothetical protein